MSSSKRGDLSLMMNIIDWMYRKTMGVPGSLNSEATVFNQWRVLILRIFHQKTCGMNIYIYIYIISIYIYIIHDLSYKKVLRGLQRPTQQPASCDGPERPRQFSWWCPFLTHIPQKSPSVYIYTDILYIYIIHYHSISISIYFWWSLCFYRVSDIFWYTFCNG